MENKNLRVMEEAELEVVLFGDDDVVVTSGYGNNECTPHNCTSHNCGTDNCTPDDCGTNTCQNDICNTNTCNSNVCNNKATCLAAGTKITIADGSVKNIEDVREGDMVLTLDHEAGCFVGKPVVYAYKGDAPKCAFTLKFDNGAELSIVGEHDLFQQESNKYVFISEENARSFIGKHFYSAADKRFAQLLSVTNETEASDYYELYTAKTFNTVANGMLNVADDVDYLLNIYEFGADFKADEKALAQDISAFGLRENEDRFGFTAEEYENWGLKYIDVAAGKGLKSIEEIEAIHDKYMSER